MVVFASRLFSRINLLQKIGLNSIFLLTLVIIFCLIIDNSIEAISFVISGQNPLFYRICGFSIVIVFTVITQTLFLNMLRKINLNQGIMHSSRKTLIKNLPYVVQFTLMTILIFTLFQTVFLHGYYRDLILTSAWISIISASSLLALLTTRLILWLKNNMDYTVLAYTSAISIIFANLLFTLLYITDTVTDDPVFIGSERNAIVAYTSSATIFSHGYYITSILSFLSVWVSSVLLLRHYSKKIGRLKLWIILGIALVYFIGQFQYGVLQYFGEVMSDYPFMFDVVYTFVLKSSTAIGGILAGIALWSVAKKVEQYNVRKYLMLAAYGIMLLLASTQAITLITSPYPPYGIATLTFMSIASFSMLIGIYFSVVYVSQDRKLRQEISRSSKITEQLRFLKNMGRSQIEGEIQKSVKLSIKKLSTKLEEESGIQTDWEENIKDYVDMVLKEREKIKKA